MQPSLFDDDDECQSIECKWPQLDGASGYRYGCRCTRCGQAKSRGRHPTSNSCNHDGCNQPRLKHRRWCVDHLPEPKAGAVLSEGACELCGSMHRWYESVLARNIREHVRDLYRRTCGTCRNQHAGVIKRHHLTTAWGLRLITTTSCELCGQRLSRAQSGRPNVVVDHDHACCPGDVSCGQCVRGLLCPRCNRDIAGVEQVVRSIGLERVTEYLARLG